MTPTPNTPANADIAREAAILMHENSYFRNGLLTPNAFIDAATAEIRKAIERDRAERVACPKFATPDEVNKQLDAINVELIYERDALKKQLAEQSAALVAAKEAVEWCLGMSPLPCRCLDFATPPHVCVAHKSIAQIEALAGGKGARS